MKNFFSIKTSLVFSAFFFSIPGFCQADKQAVVNNIFSKSPVTLDIGAIDDFQDGLAVYRKGENFGVLDKNGNDLIPLGKYYFAVKVYKYGNYYFGGFQNGMCIVKDPETGKSGYIDTSGNLAVACLFDVAYPFQRDGYGYAEYLDEKAKKYYRCFINKKGKRFYIDDINGEAFLNQPFLPIGSTQNSTVCYRKNGTKAFETTLKYLGEYGDGMIISRLDITGIGSKYGFADTTGKLIIPHKFTGEIHKFCDGLALYQPGYKDEYQYAFINKKGEEAFRLKESNEVETFADVSNFKYGYAQCELRMQNRNVKTALIDKSGKIIIVEDLFKQANDQIIKDLSNVPGNNFEFRFSDWDQFGIYFSCKLSLLPKSVTATKLNIGEVKGGSGGIGWVNEWWQTSGTGLMDFNGNIIIPPVFSSLGAFDPISRLAKATINTSDKNQSMLFINLEGKPAISLSKAVPEIMRN